MKEQSWSKAIAVSGLVLLISLGLCGLNAAAFSHFNLPISGGSVPGQESREHWARILVMTGMVESVGIVIGVAGVVVSVVGAAVSAALKARQPREGDTE